MDDTDRADLHNFDEAFARGDIPTCANVFQQRFTRAPEDPITRVLATRLHAITADPDGARVALQKLVEANPDIPEVRAYYAHLLSVLRDTDAAREEANAAVVAAPDSFPAAFALGVAELAAGDAAAATTTLARAAELDERSSAARFYLGKAYEAAGDVQHADEAYGAATTLAPNFTAAWQGRARLLATAGNLDDARGVLDEAVQHNPGDAMLRQLRVHAALQAGDDEAARQALLDIPEVDRDVDDECQLAVLSLGARRWDEALAHIDTAAKKDENHWRPPYLRALALEGQGQGTEEVAPALERAVANGDPDGTAGTRLGLMLLTRPEIEDAPRAVKVLEAAAERSSRAPATLLNLALAVQREGEDARAAALADEVRKHDAATDTERDQAERVLAALNG